MDLLLLPVGTPLWLVLSPGPSIQPLEWFLPLVPGYALVLSLIAASQADLTATRCWNLVLPCTFLSSPLSPAQPTLLFLFLFFGF